MGPLIGTRHGAPTQAIFSAHQHNREPEDPLAILRHDPKVHADDDAVHNYPEFEQVRHDELPALRVLCWHYVVRVGGGD